MPWVQPSGTVYIIKTNIDINYNHTIYFESLDAQRANFINAYPDRIRLTEQTYQRITRGIMRVGVPIADMLKYNYMFWFDTAHGNKIYFAFIANYEYVNEGCTEISYELDVLQTYLFDMELNRCFIERQHAETDVRGDNLQPEPVQPGEMLGESPYLIADTSYCYIAIMVGEQNESSRYSEYTARIYDNIATGGTIRLFNPSDTIGIQNFIRTSRDDNDKNTLVNSIKGIYAIPKILLPLINVPSGGVNLPSGTLGVKLQYPVPNIDTDTPFGSYKPKNMKMYTYPYCYLNITNASGTAIPYRYEFFQGVPRFEIYGTITRPVQVCCRAVGYGALSTGERDEPDVLQAITLNGFQQGEWNTGGFDAWQAANSIPQIANVTLGAVGGITISSKDTTKRQNTSRIPMQFGVLKNTLGGIVGAMVDDYRASYNAPDSRGTIINGGGNTVFGFNNFYAVRMRCHSQKARVIDEFMTMMGYAQNKIDVPNLNARAGWTYVKTQNCCVGGSIPGDYRSLINDIFDNGVTWWKEGRNMFRYDRDNTPNGAREAENGEET